LHSKSRTNVRIIVLHANYYLNSVGLAQRLVFASFYVNEFMGVYALIQRDQVIWHPKCRPCNQVLVFDWSRAFYGCSWCQWQRRPTSWIFQAHFVLCIPWPFPL
jgi:hypothetical protein